MGFFGTSYGKNLALQCPLHVIAMKTAVGLLDHRSGTQHDNAERRSIFTRNSAFRNVNMEVMRLKNFIVYTQICCMSLDKAEGLKLRSHPRLPDFRWNGFVPLEIPILDIECIHLLSSSQPDRGSDLFFWPGILFWWSLVTVCLSLTCLGLSPCSLWAAEESGACWRFLPFLHGVSLRFNESSILSSNAGLYCQ